MKVVTIKGSISGIVGLLGAISAAISGQIQMFIPVGFGLFFFALLIQYGSIKFKIVTSLTTLLGFVYFSNSENINELFSLIQSKEVNIFG